MQKIKKTVSKKLRNLKVTPDVLYKKIVEHMNEGVWMGDENERTVYANPKFCKMVECSLEEMIGKESYDFWDEESGKTVREVNMGKRKKGISSSYEGTLISRSGKKTPVLLSGTPLPDGGTIGIMTDLSELKQKTESEKMLSSAIQHSSDAIIIFNSESEIKSWNKGAKVIFGYKKEEVLGQKIDKLFSVDQIANFFKHPNGFYNLKLKSSHKNTGTLTIAATLTTITNEKENSFYYLLIARDITNQLKFEEELSLKYQKIQEAYNRFGVIRRQMEYILEILELLNSSYDPENIADYIVSSLIMLTKTDACILRIYNKEKNTLDLVSCFGVEDWKGKASIKYSGSLAEKAYMNKSSLKIVDISNEPSYQSLYLAKKNNLCSLLLIPLVFKEKLIGSLSLYVKPEKKLAIFENEFLEKYAKIIDIAIYTIFLKN